MADHHSNREIATDLELQLETVKSYAKAICRKLGVSSRSEAVAAARARGWLS
jgi:DNA-binding NarL/FixJ family response regulator